MRTVHVIYKSYKVKLAYLRFPLSLFILNRVMINIYFYFLLDCSRYEHLKLADENAIYF